MRQITKESTRAFIDGDEFNKSNTKVMGNKNNAVLTLFGNVIATREDDRIILTDSGYKTDTTKERLNGILWAISSEWRIYKLKGNWYITDGTGVRKDWTGMFEVTA